MKTNKQIIFSSLLGLLIMLGSSVNTINACTGIRLMANDKSVVYGRTMEWGEFDLNSRITIIPRGYEFAGQTPDGMNGKKWTSKYGVVGLNLLDQDYLADGMNEAGLTAGLFYHPGFETYNDYDKNMAENTISPLDITNYILSQYSTLDEVREGLSDVRVIKLTDKGSGIEVNAHWMVTSPQGKSIVIEFVKGKVRVFDNPLGVITNAPTYDWHMTNLRNYINLSASALPDKKIEDLDFTPLGVGSGMIGLPGDFTPPSRLVRAVAWTQTARPTPTPTETVYELFRILDNFNVPLAATEKGSNTKDSTPGMRSSTEWTTAWDLSNRVLYYHTQNNRRVRALKFSEIDFSNLGNDIIHMPLDEVKEQDIKYLTLNK